MCCKYARVINEELSLPPRSEYFRPPFVGVNFVPGPPRLVEDNAVFVAPPGLYDELVEDLDFSRPLEDQLPPESPGPRFCPNGVVIYSTPGRAYRRLAPPPLLPPRGHGSRGPSPAQGSAPRVGRGRAALADLIRSMRNPGRSRN